MPDETTDRGEQIQTDAATNELASEDEVRTKSELDEPVNAQGDEGPAEEETESPVDAEEEEAIAEAIEDKVVAEEAEPESVNSEEEADADEPTPVGRDEESESAEESEEPDDGEEAPAVDDKKKWYVVKVQSGREESIKEAIEKRVKIEGLEEYFGQILIPMEKETVMSRGKRVVREKKKFPGYIMANVEYNDQILYLFRETSGVGDFVGGGPNQPPQPMSKQEVERMIGHVEPGKKQEVAPPSPFSRGDIVRVKDGVFSGMEGEVKEVLEDKGEIRIEVVVLGRLVPVELEYWQVERA